MIPGPAGNHYRAYFQNLYSISTCARKHSLSSPPGRQLSHPDPNSASPGLGDQFTYPRLYQEQEQSFINNLYSPPLGRTALFITEPPASPDSECRRLQYFPRRYWQAPYLKPRFTSFPSPGSFLTVYGFPSRFVGTYPAAISRPACAPMYPTVNSFSGTAVRLDAIPRRAGCA